jgi:[acyl-carrier-protein] S-malonyltransferase
MKITTDQQRIDATAGGRALLVPGQGSQRPGMLTPWLEVPDARDLLDDWSRAGDIDLVGLGTEGGAEDLADTAVAQPLLTAAAMLALTVLEERHPLAASGTPVVVAGHSVGELGALAAAGVLSKSDAVAVAATRGRAMADACASTPTGMAAILGGDPHDVASATIRKDLELANVNGAGQLVVAGRSEALDALAAEPPKGAKVRRLQVAGAFHTRWMAEAGAALEAHLASVRVADPRHVLLSNFDGRVVSTGAEAVALVAGQMTRAVRWDRCQRTMRAHAITDALELPPSGVLSGIAKRALPGVAVRATKVPSDLERPVGDADAAGTGSCGGG